MSTLATVLSSFVLAAPFGDGKAAGIPPLRWERSLDQALAQSKRANSFVFVALPDDRPGEGHGQLKGPFWQDDSLRIALGDGVSVVGSTHRHVESESGVDAQGREMDKFCTRYGQVVCDQHREIEKQVLARYFNGEEPAARPAFLVLRGADGAMLAKHVGPVTPSTLADVLRACQANLDPDLDAVVPADLMGRASSESDVVLRQGALEALASLSFPAADHARRHLYSTAASDAIRSELFSSLWDAGNGAMADLAQKALDAKDTNLRGCAAEAFAAAGARSAAEPLLKRLAVETSEAVRVKLLAALGRSSHGSDKAKAVLFREAAANSALGRAAAALALGCAEQNDTDTSKLLLDHLTGDRDARVRASAAVGLVLSHPNDAKGSRLAAELRARSSKEKDPRVLDVLNTCIAFVEGNMDLDVRRPLETALEPASRE